MVEVFGGRREGERERECERCCGRAGGVGVGCCCGRGEAVEDYWVDWSASCIAAKDTLRRELAI